MQTFALENNYLKAIFLDYGAILHQLWVRTEKGEEINVIQGLDTPEAYLKDKWSKGALIGRFAGRLTESYTLNSIHYPLTHQEGVLLHSGPTGWGKQFWKCTAYTKDRLVLNHQCAAGNSGFPGNVNAQITYRLQERALVLDYYATTDVPTHINLTNHAYFSLYPEGKIAAHELQISAQQYLELAENLVPTGKLLETLNTTMDFRQKRMLGSQKLDDYFVLEPRAKSAATLYSPTTHISMKIQTDQPGVVVFTPPHFEAICFETQKFSNSPNLSHFPSTRIDPNEPYRQKTRFEFSGIVKAKKP
ncbi:MAG: aldose epimerase family protein [Flavobacteriaceae bacterium]